MNSFAHRVGGWVCVRACAHSQLHANVQTSLVDYPSLPYLPSMSWLGVNSQTEPKWGDEF